MKLSEWAKKQGIGYKTAWRWFNEGKIKNATQMDNGTILVEDGEIKDDIKTVLTKIEGRLGEIEKTLKEKI